MPEKTTNNIGFTDKDNVADAVYVVYVDPVVVGVMILLIDFH